jgi:hypothetical protein
MESDLEEQFNADRQQQEDWDNGYQQVGKGAFVARKVFEKKFHAEFMKEMNS